MPSGCARIRTSSIFITTFRPHESGYVECAPRICLPARWYRRVARTLPPWFRNIKSGTPFDAGRQSTDYSLQLSVGIANFTANHGASSAMATH